MRCLCLYDLFVFAARRWLLSAAYADSKLWEATERDPQSLGKSLKRQKYGLILSCHICGTVEENEKLQKGQYPNISIHGMCRFWNLTVY